MLDKPLSTLECLSSVVDPKSNSTNKHRYVIASQDGEARAFMRKVAGVPLVYISRSVMIMEPMADATERVKEREERGKLRAGLKNRRGEQVGVKRKRDMEESANDGTEKERDAEESSRGAPKRRKRGPKGPNPLSVKKPKRRSAGQAQTTTSETGGNRDADQQSEIGLKKKRKRKHGSAKDERPVTDAVEERPVGNGHDAIPIS
jgi:U3 small nucleolar RNA-associated protein 23